MVALLHGAANPSDVFASCVFADVGLAFCHMDAMLSSTFYSLGLEVGLVI